MIQQQLRPDLPIFMTRIPEEIVAEIKQWIVDCKKIKDHKLSYLKQHDNVGNNSFQVAIPKRHIDDGFFLSYLLRFMAQCYGDTHRYYKLREHSGHFDGYDIWANFTYKNDDNPSHTHSADYSGVLYVDNDKTPTIFDEHDIGYTGENNTMIVFPGNMSHKVDSKQSDGERITVAFNILRHTLSKVNK